MIDFNADGTITIDLDDGGELLVLKRPKYGQFKRFRLELPKLQERMEKARDEFPEPAPLPDDASAEEREARTRAQMERNEALEDASSGLLLAWWRLVIVGDNETKGLGSRGLPMDDDLPNFLIFGQQIGLDEKGEETVTGTTLSMVMKHWRQVPLDRGAMGHPTPVR